MIFKIIVSKTDAHPNKPWITTNTNRITNGTGFVIAIGNYNYILTNAHTVSNSNIIKADDFRVNKIYESIWHDLALLECPCDADPFLFNNIHPGEQVTIIGYPRNSKFSSNVCGRVNRLVETNNNGYFSTAYEITSSVNGGNSGSPVLNSQNQVVGILYGAHLNKCFAISNDTILHFINCYSNNKIPAVIGVNLENSENINLHQYYNTSGSGCYVTTSDYSEIQKHDFITEICGHKIDCNGLIKCGHSQVPWWCLITSRYAFDEIHLKLIRNGLQKNIKITLLPISQPQIKNIYGLIFKKQPNQKDWILVDVIKSSATFGYDKIGLKLQNVTKHDNFIHFTFTSGEVIVLSINDKN